jgi:hypothetical protein
MLLSDDSGYGFRVRGLTPTPRNDDVESAVCKSE